MRLSTDVLYGLLSERFPIRRCGKGIKAQDFSIPSLFDSSTMPVTGGIYVAQTGGIPRNPPDDCLFICCGPKPPATLSLQRCEVFHVTDSRESIVDVFNATVSVLSKLFRWETRMLELAVSGAPARDLVEQSIPIFDNGICVSDYDLRILADCRLDDDAPELGLHMRDKYERVPIDILAVSTPEGGASTSSREPYLVSPSGIPTSYCVNLFIGQDYIGTCALREDVQPFRSYDFELFQLFAGFIRNILSPRIRSAGGQFVTMRSVFQQLLDSYPVSNSDLAQALGIVEYNLGDRPIGDFKWCCIAMKNQHHNRRLPEEYLVETLEELLPHAAVLVHDETLVAFCLLEAREHRLDALEEPLGGFLEDMGFVAGVSRTFLDPYHARRFFDQALAAVELGGTREPERRMHLFGNHALDYMLDNCCGNLGVESLVAPELVRLWRFCGNGPEYVATLRRFLDNDCRITQTADDLFLHRSTLIKRLEKIERYVNLDDPDRRLYLRMCLHLPGIEQVLEDNRDVSDLG